jgi:hypothetical protein
MQNKQLLYEYLYNFSTPFQKIVEKSIVCLRKYKVIHAHHWFMFVESKLVLKLLKGDIALKLYASSKQLDLDCFITSL